MLKYQIHSQDENVAKIYYLISLEFDGIGFSEKSLRIADFVERIKGAKKKLIVFFKAFYKLEPRQF